MPRTHSAEFRAAQAERMRANNADPVFAARNVASKREMHANPEFARRHSERMRAIMARRCDFCLTPFSTTHPVAIFKDDDGEPFMACRDLDHCDARFAGIPR